MCLILVLWRARPEYPCVLAANRDEFHARPSAGAHWWTESPGILAGKDLQAGGTWLGVGRDGRFAALTNFRNGAPARSDAPSRGKLVTEVLESGASVADSLDRLRSAGPRYNPFNMLLSDGQRLGVYESVTGQGRELGPGVYGLSNHLLDTPWPKVRNAKMRLSSALTDLSDENAILRLLRDERPAPDHELPRTGVRLEWERLLSSAFIRAEEYGTRCTTLLRIDRDGEAQFDEWTWDKTGGETAHETFRFDVSRG
ncbi:MAG TPA: NRDE family protein [Steroidobacteraceae bacterium]|jgi:uncharacterized protein with NRDE domain|nr:NRDE family protein [Steroidobacteraceae bacterium]